MLGNQEAWNVRAVRTRAGLQDRMAGVAGPNRLFIGGELVDAADGSTIPVIDWYPR
jgi:hypothetical protein